SFTYQGEFGHTASNDFAGDVWINANFAYNLAPTVGNYGMMALVHEIGHAMGFNHPSDYGGGALTYDADASYREDDRQYTIMSYFSETNTGASYASLYPSAPQLHDIAAAQYLYGANTATRTGDTIYGFNSNSGRDYMTITNAGQQAVFAIWDAGGNDTLDL